MSSEPESFLARWSRRKRAADEIKRSSESGAPAGSAASAPTAASAPVAAAPSVPGVASASTPASTAAHESITAPEIPLPPIESLDGLRSDYQAFFQQPVAEDLRHAALRKLFADPHFNQMDMLDVYVDDYTQFEPLPQAMKLRLASARAFLSDSERAEVEAAEQEASATASGAQEAPLAGPGGAQVDSASDPLATPGEVATSNPADEPFDAAPQQTVEKPSGPSS